MFLISMSRPGTLGANWLPVFTDVEYKDADSVLEFISTLNLNAIQVECWVNILDIWFSRERTTILLISERTLFKKMTFLFKREQGFTFDIATLEGAPLESTPWQTLRWCP